VNVISRLLYALGVALDSFWSTLIHGYGSGQNPSQGSVRSQTRGSRSSYGSEGSYSAPGIQADTEYSSTSTAGAETRAIDVSDNDHAIALSATQLPDMALVVQQIKAGRHDKAESVLRRIIAERPEDPDAQMYLAIALSGQERYSEAIGHAESALRLGAGDRLRLRILLGEAYCQLGQLDNSIHHLREAVDEFPNDIDLRIQYASVLSKRRGGIDLAIEQLQHALTARPDSLEIHAILGKLYLQRGELENAKAEFLKLQTDARGNKELILAATNGLIQVHWMTGEFSKVRAEAESALAMDPSDSMARVGLGYSLIADRNYTEALRMLEGYEVTGYLRADYLCCLGYALVGLTRYDEALAKFKEAAELAPDSSEAHHGLSRCYSALGKPGLADIEYGKALRLKRKGQMFLEFEGIELSQIPTMFGSYKVVQRDYSGEEFARIHLAEHVESKQPALVVELTPAASASEDAVTRFRREIDIAKMLDHPGIARIYEDGLDELNDRYYYVMEFIDESLQDVIEREAPLAPERIIHIGVQTCDAVDYFHRFRVPKNPKLHIVHRDLKPKSILITSDGKIKISDFGRARFSETVAATGKTGSPVIDSTYASPEWMKGLVADARTDVYSIGAILYPLATGTIAHTPEDPDNLVLWTQAKEQLPPPPSDLNPSIPAGLSAVILKAMEPERSKRYQSARELAEALRGVVMAGGSDESLSEGPEEDPTAADSEVLASEAAASSELELESSDGEPVPAYCEGSKSAADAGSGSEPVHECSSAEGS
jgi:serine/threonine protein kinase/Flp pilus assembly protein TadD